MATQSVEFSAASGQTVTARLFSAGSDTVVQTASAVTEATNRDGVYTATFTDAAAGLYRLIATNSGGTLLAQWWVDLTLTTATFQSYEMPVSVMQSGLSTFDPGSDAVTVGSMDANTLTASALATDAVTEIQNGLSTLDAAGVRTAVGLASANLDTQLADLPTVTEFEARTLVAASYFDSAVDTVTVGAMNANTLTASALATDAVTEIQSGLSTLDQAGVRTAVGMASANLDTQLGDIPTVSEFEARTLVAASYFDPAVDSVTVGAMNANTVTASALATDAVTEIQNGLSTLDAAGVRSAVGLASANLDTQLADLPTVSEFEARTLAAAAYFDPAADTVANVTTVGSVSGSVTVGTNNDKTGYSLTTTPPTAAAIADAVWDESTAGHTTAGTYGGRIVRATNSNVEVQITGSNHIAADVHEFQDDVLTSDATAASFVSEVQSGLATSAALAVVDGIVDQLKSRSGYTMSILAGAISNAQSASESYTITLDDTVYGVTYSGLDSTGNRTGATLSES